jgi:isoquinoline 1-oxidoreductase beta subunit
MWSKMTEEVIEATYETPLLAHACLEPTNATALYKDGNLTLWGASQAPWTMRLAGRRGAKRGRAKISGKMTPIVMPAGGSFGLKGEWEVFQEATELAIQVPGKPVKVIWSREEDIRHDVYRSDAISKFRAYLDEQNLPKAWHHRIVGQSLLNAITKRLISVSLDVGRLFDYRFIVEGADHSSYAIPNQRVEVIEYKTHVPIGFWRSNGHGNNAFFTESFLDECAHEAGTDPLEYRRRLLQHNPRYLRILDLLESKSQWHRPLASGRGRGIAIHASYGSIVGQVAEVTVDASNRVSVDRVVCAVDCGKTVNPDTVIAQMEGGIIFALSAILFGEITIEGGKAKQSGYSDYEMVRMSHTPRIETHIVESDEDPGGVGEPVVPATFGAIPNAVTAASGTRIRSLPITKHGFQCKSR